MILSARISTAAALLLLIGTSAQAAPADDAAIRQVEVQQEAAWNAHDAHAYVELLTEDVDLVEAQGWWWKSRAEVEQKLTGAFAYMYVRSLLHVDDVAIRYLSPDLASVHVTWTMTGATKLSGSSLGTPLHGIQAQVLRRTDAGWRILSAQNTLTTPERAFPTGPAPVAAAKEEEDKAEKADKTDKTDTRPCLLASRNGNCIIHKGK